MKRKNSGSVRVWSVLGKAGLLILLAAAALDGSGRADADGPEPNPTPPEDPLEPGAWELHTPHTLYPDGEGAILFSELSPEEQGGVLEAGEQSDYGAAVHNAWSQNVTHPQTADAKVQKAARHAGTTGLASIGVEP